MKSKADPNAKFAFELILGWFNGNVDYANHWFNSYNLLLGDVPANLLKLGLTEQLLQWIKEFIQKETNEKDRDDY